MIHKLTHSEQSFTSTGSKLAAHYPIFEKLRDTGHASIIRATMTLHQVCSSRCSYCSTSRRNKKDSITLEEAQAFVRRLYVDQALHNFAYFPKYDAAYRELRGSPIRLQGLILSGGGQPNLWPHFAELVDWLQDKCPEVKLGLITNGFPEKVPEWTYDAFAWIRISVTPPEASMHYPGGNFAKQHIPVTVKRCGSGDPGFGTVGYSYVVGPWTTDDDLLLLDKATVDHGFAYARVLVDCNLARTAQLEAHTKLGERLERLGLVCPDGTPTSKVFHQLKYHGTPAEAAELWDEGQCFLQSYNVFWDTTGHEENGRSFCYPCDSVTVLAEENAPEPVVSKSQAKRLEIMMPGRRVVYGEPSARRFEPKWGTVTNDRVADLWEKPLRAYFDPREQCSACLFMKNNREVKALRENVEGVLDVLREAPALNLEHVEFP